MTMKKIRLGCILLCLLAIQLSRSQEPLLQNAYNRPATLLNGNWKYVIDPYDTGYRNHRNWLPFDQAGGGVDPIGRGNSASSSGYKR